VQKRSWNKAEFREIFSPWFINQKSLISYIWLISWYFWLSKKFSECILNMKYLNSAYISDLELDLRIKKIILMMNFRIFKIQPKITEFSLIMISNLKQQSRKIKNSRNAPHPEMYNSSIWLRNEREDPYSGFVFDKIVSISYFLGIWFGIIYFGMKKISKGFNIIDFTVRIHQRSE